MNEKSNTEFRETPGIGYEVKFPERTSPTEAAQEIIKHAVEPYRELERVGVVEGLTIVLYGGTVDKLSPPKDYDLLVLYEGVSDIDPAKKKGLSPEAGRLYDGFFYDAEHPPEGAAHSSNYYSRKPPSGEDEVPHAKYAEIFLTSKDAFLEHLNESDHEKLKRSFDKLSALPEYIYQDYVPPGETLNSAPHIDWDRIDDAALFCMVFAKAVGYVPESNQLKTLYARSPKLREALDGVMFDELHAAAEHFVNQNIESVLTSEEIAVLEDGEGGGESISVLHNYVKRYLESSRLREAGASRVWWLFESMSRKMNIEEAIVNSGIVLHGDNLTREDKPLFKEDKKFIPEKSTPSL